MSAKQNISLFNSKLAIQAIKDSFVKLNPALLIKNPVIFIVAIGSLLTTIIVFTGIFNGEFAPEAAIIIAVDFFFFSL